ncbi:MAG: glycosyltransferase family 39 protein [Anaerolineae bacterium]|nr:glycosyltransferase family 39 protein [Anaerolineae bacterium]
MKLQSASCTSPIRRHPQATVILIGFIILGLIYSLVTPPFEAGDESRHYAVIKYMADTGRLIVQNAPETASLAHHWSHEGNQPPLYYALAALLTFWIDSGSWDDVFWYNPHTTIGNPLRPDNKNITIHPPGENWPWRKHVLAVHLIRFLSLAMAAVTVVAAYGLALKLFTGNRWSAAGAMAITAFNPMFIFISASINNDNAVIMFVTLALWLMVKLADRQGRKGKEGMGLPLYLPALLGLLIGLGSLSKLYALGLLPLAGLLFLWLALDKKLGTRKTFYTSHFWRNLLLWNLTMLAVVAVVAGWFYLRNALLYNGDFLALQVMRDTAGQRDKIPSLATLRAEFEGFRIAYWALFGGVNILADNWLYTALDWISLIAVTGVVVFIVTRITYHVSRVTFYVSKNIEQISLPTFALLLAWYGIMVAGFIVWNLTQPAGQGRLLYPAIAAISALGMLGLTWWLPSGGQRAVALGYSVALFGFALAASFLYIVPVYAKPAILTEADLPADLQPVNLVYDGKVRLLGYQLPVKTVRPAETLPLTLYWQLLEPADLDYSIFIHLLGRQRQVIGQLDTYPGGGQWPTTLLSPGDILADAYQVPIMPEAELNHAPTRLLIAAGIYDWREPGCPGKLAVNADGQPVEPIIASAKLIPWQWPTPDRSDPPVDFLDKASLLSYQIATDQQTLTLTWQANQPLAADYTIFIQAWRITPPPEQAAGFDGPPVQGAYPTSLWAPGEIIVDSHPLDLSNLPPGEYNLRVGLYNPATGERLPAFGPDGLLPDYAVKVGVVQGVSQE